MAKNWWKIILVVLVMGVNTKYTSAEQLYVSGRSAILMDMTTGSVIWEKNAYQPLPMASTTKIMTAILALEIGDLSDKIKVSAGAAGKDGSSMYLLKDEKLTLEELLYGILLSSGNDACVAVAEHYCGTEEKYVALMNKMAAKLGARGTHFMNTNGLPARGHFSTSYDLALITRYALKNPVFREIVAAKHYYVPRTNKREERYLYNHNKLLWRYRYADGVKTGYTKESGKCLVASGTKDGHTLIAVVLNSKDMYQDTARMLEYGFKNFVLYKPWRLGKPLAYIEVAKKKKVPLVASREINLLLPRAWKKEKIKIKLKCPKKTAIPFLALQKKGSVKVFYEGKLLAEAALVAKYDS